MQAMNRRALIQAAVLCGLRRATGTGSATAPEEEALRPMQTRSA